MLHVIAQTQGVEIPPKLYVLLKAIVRTIAQQNRTDQVLTIAPEFAPSNDDVVPPFTCRRLRYDQNP